jgi:hypothetical protein
MKVSCFCVPTSVLAVAAALCVAPTARAHPGHTVPLEELARGAALIVEGQVSGVESAWNAQHSQIYTTVTVQVRRYLKGSGAARLQFRYLGGVVGDQTLAIVGQAAFARNENVLLFLDPRWSEGVFPVLDGEHGKFRVMVDTQRNREYLFNPGLDLSKSEALDLIRRINAGLGH